MILRVINTLVFAWWDGVLSCAAGIFNGASWLANFALARMQDTTRELIRIDESELNPEAVTYAAKIDKQREELHEVMRGCVAKLNELDAIYVRIHHIGRKSK